MKNKIKFSGKNKIQEKQFTDEIKTETIDKQKSNKKTFSKIIRGKVRVYDNNYKPNLWNHKQRPNNDESELTLLSDRMIVLIKFIFVIVVLFFLFLKFRNNPTIV